MPCDHRCTGPDDLVGTKLYMLSHLPGDLIIFRISFQADVQRHVLVPHMEAVVYAAVFSVKCPADDVLAAVTLHIVKPVSPVQNQFCRCIAARLRKIRRPAVHHMKDFTILLVNIQNLKSGQGAPVTALTAALREKQAPVQGDDSMPFLFTD